MHIYNWDEWAQKTIPVPMTIGHEFVGIVEAVGDHVKGFAHGDLSWAKGHITCGRCRNCLAGRQHLANTQGVGVNRPGAWAEFVAIPRQLLACWIRRSRWMSFLFRSLGNTIHTALSLDLVGEDVLVAGAGPIGCMAIPIAKRRRAARGVTDVNDYRFESARTIDADDALNVRTRKGHLAMQKLAMEEGFDVELEISGNPKAFADIFRTCGTAATSRCSE